MWQIELEAAQEAAAAAGQIIRRYFQEGVAMRTKESFNLVSDADIEAAQTQRNRAETWLMSAREIEQQAALWLVRREEPEWTAADEAMLAAWLEESMAHKAAFWRLEFGWREADRIRGP